MAEKKVGGKGKRSEKKSAVFSKSKDKKTDNNIQNEYEEFWDKYGAQLRSRSTERTQKEQRPERKQSDGTASSRSGEINPYTTVNPVAEHQISKKRSGKMIADDTGFKAYSYNQRFELKPKMPESEESGNEEEIPESAIPGQQTMADLISTVPSEEQSAVPIEGQIEKETSFADAYKKIKEDGTNFGKGEKLRAIARTAAEDEADENENQLVFPAFDPLFSFKEEPKDKKRNIKIRKKSKEKNIKATEQQPFDIDEKDIVTNHSGETEVSAEAETTAVEEQIKTESNKRFFDTLNKNDNIENTSVPFEINKKSDVRPILAKINKLRIIELVKTAAILLAGTVLLIVSLVFDGENSQVSASLYSNISLLFLVCSMVICVKNMIDGVKDLLHAKPSAGSATVFIVIAALVQIIFSYFAGDGLRGSIQLLAPSAIFSLINLTLPKIFLYKNTHLASSMFGGSNVVSVMKNVSESGIEGSFKNAYASDGGFVRYPVKTGFAANLIEKLTSAVPRPYAGGVVYTFFTLLAIASGVATGIIDKSVLSGLTVFIGFLTVCLPTAYTSVISFILLKTNMSLAEDKSSLLSYRSAAELTDTKAFIFDAAEFIDEESCSIHGIKPFGTHDPKKSALYCASLLSASKSPLDAIMRHATADSEEEIPEAEEILVADGKGVAGIVDGNKVLLGTKDFLTENHVYVPDKDFEEKFVTGDRKLLFLSVNGEFCMLMIVSYYIQRSISAFLKYLSKKNIKAVVYSADPNITGEYIEKKCKLKKGSVVGMTAIEAAYFRETEAKPQTSVPADVFTNGKITSQMKLIRSAFSLASVRDFLPLMIYAACAVGLILLVIPVFADKIHSIGNIYILIIRAVSIILCCAFSLAHAKRNK